MVEHGVSEHPMAPPYVVKPVNQGSSVGVEIVAEGSNKVPDALSEKGWAFDGVAMVEKYIAGHELTCGVMGDTALDDGNRAGQWLV